MGLTNFTPPPLGRSPKFDNFYLNASLKETPHKTSIDDIVKENKYTQNELSNDEENFQHEDETTTNVYKDQVKPTSKVKYKTQTRDNKKITKISFRE